MRGVKVVQREGQGRPVAAHQRVEAVDAERREAVNRAGLVQQIVTYQSVGRQGVPTRPHTHTSLMQTLHH